jgi:hypothetical protein
MEHWELAQFRASSAQSQRSLWQGIVTFEKKNSKSKSIRKEHYEKYIFTLYTRHSATKIYLKPTNLEYFCLNLG